MTPYPATSSAIIPYLSHSGVAMLSSGIDELIGSGIKSGLLGLSLRQAHNLLSLII